MIRPITRAHLAEAIALLDVAGLAAGAALIERYLTWPGAYVGWFEEGVLIGMCGALWQGPAAFVGCMAVRPARQGEGLGRRLLAHVHDLAADHGATTLLLEATEAGAPLYARMGYLAEHATAVLVRTPAPPAPVVAPLPAADRAAILALDRAVLAVDRGSTLRALLAEPVAAHVVREPDGHPRAYALRIGNRLGPCVAVDPAAGEAALRAVEAGGEILTVPTPCAPALALGAALGFAPVRELTRMRLGPPLGDPRNTWALLSAGAG